MGWRLDEEDIESEKEKNDKEQKFDLRADAPILIDVELRWKKYRRTHKFC